MLQGNRKWLESCYVAMKKTKLKKKKRNSARNRLLEKYIVAQVYYKNALCAGMYAVLLWSEEDEEEKRAQLMLRFDTLSLMLSSYHSTA